MKSAKLLTTIILFLLCAVSLAGMTNTVSPYQTSDVTSTHKDGAFQDATNAKECLEETDGDIDWNKNGNPPVVRLMFEYENTCSKAISCQVRVDSGHSPKGSKNGDYSKWELIDSLTFKFTLSAGESRKLLGTLSWFKRADTMPVLRWPKIILKRDLDKMDCSFVETLSADGPG